jgi:hypothetical protein
MCGVDGAIVQHCTTLVDREDHFRCVTFDRFMIWAGYVSAMGWCVGAAIVMSLCDCGHEPHWCRHIYDSVYVIGAVLGLMWVIVNDPYRSLAQAMAQWEHDRILFAEFGTVSP